MSTTLAIAAVARRSGFAPPTLRYYEQRGLLPAPERTAAGYRAYDESVLDRLAFIGRAKALGCSLSEIADLLPAWDSGECAPLQDRLRKVAEAKIGDAQARTADLLASTARLQLVLAALGDHTPDGPCDAACGCAADPVEPTAVPIACTLEPEEMPGRLRDWHRLLEFVTGRTPLDGGIRLELAGTTPVDELARLVQAEQACCGFFAFAITTDSRGLALEVRAPAEAQTVLTAMFGGHR
ncbi:MAG: MerR family transcriptional regulator [Acidimicrobiales bacterium]